MIRYITHRPGNSLNDPVINPWCEKNWTQSNLALKFGAEYKSLVELITNRIQYNRAEAGIGGDCDVDPNCFQERYVSCVLNAYWDRAANGQIKKYTPSTQSIIDTVVAATKEDAWKVKEILNHLYYITNSKNVYHLDNKYLDPYNYFRTSGVTTSGSTVATNGPTTATKTTTKKITTGSTSTKVKEDTSSTPVYEPPAQTQTNSNDTLLYVAGGAGALLLIYFIMR
ncbi:MAG: hypothetical protein U0264_05200 [Candidatus Kapaibacterium sp.]